MAAPLEISIGHNRFDPIGQYFAVAAAHENPDPSVASRCPASLESVVAMINRIEGSKVFDKKDPSGLHCITPDFTYSAVNGATGSVFLQTYYSPPSRGSAPEEELGIAACDLMARPKDRPLSWSITVMRLGRQSIWQRSMDTMQQGGHTELNYFLLVTRKMGEAVTAAKAAAEAKAKAESAAG
jgi:hypothetical protein